MNLRCLSGTKAMSFGTNGALTKARMFSWRFSYSSLNFRISYFRLGPQICVGSRSSVSLMPLKSAHGRCHTYAILWPRFSWLCLFTIQNHRRKRVSRSLFSVSAEHFVFLVFILSFSNNMVTGSSECSCTFFCWIRFSPAWLWLIIPSRRQPCQWQRWY